MVTVRLFGRRLRVCARTEHEAILNRVPGARYDKSSGIFTYPATPMAAAGVAKALSNARNQDWAPGATELLECWHRTRVDVKLYRDYEKADLPPLPVETKWPPWRHQLGAFWFCYNFQGVLLHIGMGGGKTKIIYDLIAARCHRRVLIVCPKNVVPEWETQAITHCVDVPLMAILEGGTPIDKRMRTAKQLFSLHTDAPRIIVINYDAVWRDKFAKWLLDQAEIDLVVCDEIHRIKDPSGKASRFMARLAEQVKYRVGLSGTPTPHSILDAYGVFRFLDAGAYGTNFAAFRSEYAVLGGFEGRQVLEYIHTEKFNKRFYAITFRCDRDVLDLPPVVSVDKVFDMSAEAVRHYDRLAEDFLTEVGSGVVTATNALTRLIRLQQVTSGFLTLDVDGQTEFRGDTPVRRHEYIDDSRAQVLAEIIDDLPYDEPLVVFCRFTKDIEVCHNVCSKRGKTTRELSGQRDELKLWQQGDGDVLIVQIQSGSDGINLTRASYAVFYSIGFSLGIFEQAMARVHRPGQKKTTTFFRVIAKKTMNVRLYRAIETKKKIIDTILADPRGFISGTNDSLQEP